MKQILLKWPCLAVAIVIVCSGALFSFDLQTGSTRTSSASLLSAALPETLLESPSAGLMTGKSKLQIGQTTFFEMSELRSYSIAAACRHQSMLIALGLNQFGTGDLYREHMIKGMVGAVHNQWSAGALGSFRLVQFGEDYDDLSAVSFGLGISWRSERLIFALAADDLNRPRLNSDSERYEPRWLMAVELIGKQSYSSIGRVRLERHFKPQFEIAQKLRVSEYGSLGWGLSTAPFVYGGGVILRYSEWEFSFTVDYHSSLGLTTVVGMNFSFGSSNKMVP